MLKTFKKLITHNASIYIILLLVASGCAHKITLPGDKKDPDRKKFTLIHFNDGESHLLNAGSGFEDYGGIARFATVINHIKKEIKSDISSTSYLTVSAGNNFLAGPVFNVSIKKGVPYYDASALDQIGVDAFTFGNHDFDLGPDILANFIKSFTLTNPVFLAANLDVSQEKSLYRFQKSGTIAGAAIIKRGGEKFGIIGITTPDLQDISSPRNVKVRKNIAAIVQQAINDLKKAGVNKIILLSHLRSIKNEVEVIKKTSGLDIVVAGGGDELLVNNQTDAIAAKIQKGTKIDGPYPMLVKDASKRNVPIVTTPGDYCYVGRLDVIFDSHGEISEILPSSKPEKVIGGNLKNAVEPDRIINKNIIIPIAKAISTSSQLIGASKVKLDGDTAHIRSRETNLGDLVADAVLFCARKNASSFNAPVPSIAMINAGAVRQTVPTGQVSGATLFAVCPFYDFITIVENISPENLKQLMETALSCAYTGKNSAPTQETGGFPQVSGMSVIYNPTRPVEKRVKQIKLDSGDLIVRNYKIVQYAPYINLATLNFLARGGNQWNFSTARKVNIGITLQNALINYISAPTADGGLNKVILKSQYPPEGIGRIMITRE